MKRCIFYLPYKLDEQASGARMLRPRKMIQAFFEIGYDVFVIEGISSERRKKIKELKTRITNGIKYDFMYTESHTEPTLLTNPNHLPTHPFLDFGFFRYVRKKGIKIGLFYCDIYWKFESYGTDLPKWKKYGALINYKYDIRQYRRLLSKFYVPDMKMCEYINEKRLMQIARELPPGADNLEALTHKKYEEDCFSSNPLVVFYVGGLGRQYKIVELIEAIQQTKGTKLVICCREAEWEKEKDELKKHMCDRVEVVHKKSNELADLYRRADVCSLMFEPDEYRGLAKPFKAYEYLSNEKPMLSTRGTAIGKFVEENEIGWNIDYNAKEISRVLLDILEKPEMLNRVVKNCESTRIRNLWKTRAEQVARDLMEEK